MPNQELSKTTFFLPTFFLPKFAKIRKILDTILSRPACLELMTY
jgi:hypothetical protein